MLTYDKETTGMKKFIIVMTECCFLITISAVLWIGFSLFNVFILKDLSNNTAISGAFLSVVFAFFLMSYGIIKINWDEEFRREW